MMRSVNPKSIDPSSKKISKKHQPKGFDILYEDKDIIVGNKAAGFLTVGAAWNKEHTIQRALNEYVRKGNAKLRKRVYVVHRLDQDTTGVLIFAKTEQAQIFLKDNWKETKKTYYVVVHGRMREKVGVISSYLEEDEDYVVYSTSERGRGKLAYTGYKVLKETNKFSLLEIDLLTGRKNQIRVHMAEEGHPVVGDGKYGRDTNYPHMALHSRSISFIHPFSGKRVTFEAEVPAYFDALIGY